MKRISDKRLAKGERLGWNSTIAVKPYEWKKRSPIKKVSDKARRLWDECRKAVFERWGHKCILCGATERLECHHYQKTRSQDPSLKYDVENIVPLCPHCHNHHGVDERFYELREQIEQKIKELENGKND